MEARVCAESPFQSFATLFSKTGPLTNVKLTDSVQLTGQQAPGVFPISSVLGPQMYPVTHDFNIGAGHPNSGPHARSTNMLPGLALGVEPCTCHPATWDMEAGGLLEARISRLIEQHSEAQS